MKMTTTAASGNGYTYSRGDRNSKCLTLTGAARTAPWSTPTASHAGGTAEQFLERKRRTRACGVAITDLGLQVSNWLSAPTASDVRYQLNPRFSLWLMGYPTEWAFCGEAVTRSSRKSPRSSSRRQSKQGD